MPKISILMPSMRVGGISLTLDGLSKQNFRDFELVFSDALWAYRHEQVAAEAARLGVPIKHVEVAGNKFPLCSYCRHMNTALVHATGEIAVLIVDYTWLPPDNLQRHADFHASHAANAGLMGPHRYTVFPKLSAAFPTYKNEDTDRYAEDVRSGKLDSVMMSIFEKPFTDDASELEIDTAGGRDCKLDLPHGPCVPTNLHCKNESVRLEHLVAINGFDEDLDGTHGWQDSDIADKLTVLRGVNWTVDPTHIAQIVNPRHCFPYGARNRPYTENEKTWRRKQYDGYPPVNTWSLAEARDRVAKSEKWTDLIVENVNVCG